MVGHVMSEQWIIRVEGKDYGPADLSMLHEWKEEGRVLPSNEARRSADHSWVSAAQIPGLFEARPEPVPPPLPKERHPKATAPQSSLLQILVETFRVYARGLPHF